MVSEADISSSGRSVLRFKDRIKLWYSLTEVVVVVDGQQRYLADGGVIHGLTTRAVRFNHRRLVLTCICIVSVALYQPSLGTYAINNCCQCPLARPLMAKPAMTIARIDNLVLARIVALILIGNGLCSVCAQRHCKAADNSPAPRGLLFFSSPPTPKSPACPSCAPFPQSSLMCAFLAALANQIYPSLGASRLRCRRVVYAVWITFFITTAS